MGRGGEGGAPVTKAACPHQRGERKTEERRGEVARWGSRGEEEALHGRDRGRWRRLLEVRKEKKLPLVI